jgi:histidinol-phosphate aminotransferase
MRINDFLRKHINESPEYEAVEPSNKLSNDSGISEKQIIKLNANENPFGATLNLGKNLSKINIHEYPDPNQLNLRSSLSDYTSRMVEEIVASSGSDELIDILIRLFLDPGDKLIDAQPTFGMYEFSARIQGASVISVPRNTDFSLDVDSIIELIEEKTKMIFIASPNNPTGNTLKENELLKLLSENIIVVVDETYYEFCGESFSKLIDKHENLVVLRSFSKWAGLAGLRIGYSIANPKLIKRIIQIKQPYNINSAAEFVAIEAIKNKKLLMEKVNILMEQKDLIYNFLNKKTGIKAYPSKANFVFCDCGDYNATDVFERLAKEGIFVRKFSNEFTKNTLRISAGTPNQTGKLLQVLDEILS